MDKTLHAFVGRGPWLGGPRQCHPQRKGVYWGSKPWRHRGWVRGSCPPPGCSAGSRDLEPLCNVLLLNSWQGAILQVCPLPPPTAPPLPAQVRQLRAQPPPVQLRGTFQASPSAWLWPEPPGTVAGKLSLPGISTEAGAMPQSPPPRDPRAPPDHTLLTTSSQNGRL